MILFLVFIILFMVFFFIVGGVIGLLLMGGKAIMDKGKQAQNKNRR